MPTLNEIIEEKLARLEGVPDTLESAVIRVQRQLYRELLEQTNRFTVTSGNIDRTTENIAKIEQIVNQIEQNALSGDYIKAITQYAKEYNTQKGLNNKIIGDVEPEDFYNKIVSEAQKGAVEALTGEQVAGQVLTPLKDMLLQNVTTGGKLSELIKELKYFAEGTEQFDGKLLKYVKSIARDAFATSDRAYTEAVAVDYGFKYYKYKGGLIKDTRCFCFERVNGIYHIGEIRDWGAKPDLWNCGNKKIKGGGRRQGTNSSTIFSYLGGYNCIHSLIPVSTVDVPEDVKARTAKFEEAENNI